MEKTVKLNNYTIVQMKDQISEFLFIKWLESDLDDWHTEEMRDLWLMYHEIMDRQVETH